MYYLMNKDVIVASVDIKPATAFSDDAVFFVDEIKNKLPFGFSDINSWISSRKSSKHNVHLGRLMRQMGCEDNLGFIRVTHAATINDTFWIKSDAESITWKDVSLYRNQFTDTVSRLAFEGLGLNQSTFSSTSPELSCEGSFRKCFRKEEKSGQYGSDIFIYKRGHEFGAGLEPYCEMLASEVASVISGSSAVSYSIEKLHDKLASKCNLFTNEQYGYASFSKLKDKKCSLQDVFDYFAGIGSEQMFREMLVIDSLCFNQDRHMGNYGVLFDNDSLEIVGMAPVFDLNFSFLPSAAIEDFETIGDKLFGIGPQLGEDFTRIGQMAMNDSLRDKVKTMLDFSFSFRGDDAFSLSRVKALENMVRKQAKAILSNEVLHTKDVFFSDLAVEKQQLDEKTAFAKDKYHAFLQKISEIAFDSNVFTSECVSSDTVQYILELNFYEITLDFVSRTITITDDMAHPVDAEELKEKDISVWGLYDTVSHIFFE